MKLSHLIVSVAFAAVGAQANAVNITGAGATFPQPVYSKWASDYQKATGNQVIPNPKNIIRCVLRTIFGEI